MKRIEALANFLGCEVEDLEIIYKDNEFRTKDGKEYFVLTDDEANEEFYDYEKNSIEELGLDLFTDWAKDYIIENCLDIDWFNEYMRENYLCYCDDIEMEKSSSVDYENRLEEEMTYAGCETKEDYISYLCEGYVDSVAWFEANFGNEELNHIINTYNLLDIEKVIDFIKEEDGRGVLASYDGIENEEEEYFIYRIN